MGNKRRETDPWRERWIADRECHNKMDYNAIPFTVFCSTNISMPKREEALDPSEQQQQVTPFTQICFMQWLN
jgi:hypothetical protein